MPCLFCAMMDVLLAVQLCGTRWRRTNHGKPTMGSQDVATAYDLRRAAQGLARRRPDARVRARVALRPFRADPGRPGWPLLRGLDAVGGPGGADLAPAPRLDGRGQHLPPSRGPCPYGRHGGR